jgi:hypothetical protein
VHLLLPALLLRVLPCLLLLQPLSLLPQHLRLVWTPAVR